ncbi:MAG TPA: hypothetical protein VMX13_02285 [Sedimentisphaerales bacterium]|nr:hypothetical protein [Sedimentisphaerales bacterium]
MKNRPESAHTNLHPGPLALIICLVLSLLSQSAQPVTSKITRQRSSADMLKGKVKDVVVGSQGTLRLGTAWETPVEEFEDVWSINSIVVIGGTVYIGTSPNGGIFEYSLGKLTKIYPLQSQEQQPQAQDENNDATDEPNDANTVEAKEYLANEHIFAMATDVAGRLLAGISGKECKLLRFEAGRMETIFEPNDARYIFAIATDIKGNIYLGTGPQGKVYRFDPFSRDSSQVIYDSPDKNILSLAAGDDGFVYAGSDDRGVIYKIDPQTGKASALYDSEQPEITALLLNKQGDLYAAATSAEMAQAESKFAAKLPLAGRPETKSTNGKTSSESDGARQLRIPNTKKASHDKSAEGKPAVPKPPKPDKASHIYKVSKEGYVTDIFSEAVVLFCLAEQDNSLLVGTGNNAQLFSVDPASEDSAVIYEDEQASQITAVTLFGKDVYVGTSNPAKLIKLTRKFAAEGSYTSDLIDAGQPAKWGKLQVEADIPPGCKIMAASRSGNVKDVNDPTLSEWTQLEEITGPVQLRCPLGRFCQYKLVLKSDSGSQSPVVHEVAVAGTVPNLAPQVELVSVGRIEAAGKEGTFKIAYKAKDDNGDKLVYKIDFRKAAKTIWIELKDELEADSFEWDGKTVEDGRYEVRVTASDERDNTPTTKLTASRISDPVIIDNTAPVIKDDSIQRGGKTVTLRLRAVDVFSAIGKVDYTIDSNDKWITAIPDDLVYDTADETFTIAIEDLKAGDHIIALRVSDDAGNTTYKTFEVAIPNS